MGRSRTSFLVYFFYKYFLICWSEASEFYTSIVQKRLIEGNVACLVLRINYFTYLVISTCASIFLSQFEPHRNPYFLREFQFSIRLQIIGQQHVNIVLTYFHIDLYGFHCFSFDLYCFCMRTYCRPLSIPISRSKKIIRAHEEKPGNHMENACQAEIHPCAYACIRPSLQAWSVYSAITWVQFNAVLWLAPKYCTTWLPTSQSSSRLGEAYWYNN